MDIAWDIWHLIHFRIREHFLNVHTFSRENKVIEAAKSLLPFPPKLIYTFWLLNFSWEKVLGERRGSEGCTWKESRFIKFYEWFTVKMFVTYKSIFYMMWLMMVFPRVAIKILHDKWSDCCLWGYQMQREFANLCYCRYTLYNTFISFF